MATARMTRFTVAALMCLSLFTAGVASAGDAATTLTATVLRRVAVTAPDTVPASTGRPSTPAVTTNTAVSTATQWAEDDQGRYLLVTVVLED